MNLVTPEVLTFTGLVGLLLPLVQSVINQPNMSRQVRRVVLVALSVLVGIGFVLVDSGLERTWQNWIVLTAAGLGAAQAFYALLYKPLGVAGAIEDRTSAARHRKDN